jgi:CheY-like chemotaxis protein
MKKILIIEDEVIVRSIYRRKFEISGYQVETAEEGASGLELLATFKPDAIQVDIMLPGMDGVQVIREIRTRPEFKNVPILVISSFYRPDLAKEAWKAGATKCVSKMDCTPNLALELVEQMLSGDGGGASPFAKLSMDSVPMDAIRLLPAESPWEEATQIITRKPKPAAGGLSIPMSPAPEVKPAPKPSTTLPSFAREQLGLPPTTAPGPPQETIPAAESITQIFSKPDPGVTRRFAKPDPGVKRATTRPTFSSPEAQKLTKPAAAAKPPDAAASHMHVWDEGGNAVIETVPSEGSAPLPSAEPVWFEKPPEEMTEEQAAGDATFRLQLWREFIKRAPQIQAELRDRVSALLKSKSVTDQLSLLRNLETTVASLASLSGITGFSRISHLSGAMDALIKDLNKKPAQMTNSVLRSIAHASDCLNSLFHDLESTPRDIPQSMLILVVDDEPIARRTISVALAKASLRCIGMEDSQAALTVLRENPFDLIFMDAEMPGLSGFELCGELRKLPTNKTTPVIFVTSLTKFEARAQSSLAGANDLIAKPFLMMELAVKALTYLLRPQPIVEAKAGSK